MLPALFTCNRHTASLATVFGLIVSAVPLHAGVTYQLSAESFKDSLDCSKPIINRTNPGRVLVSCSTSADLTAYTAISTYFGTVHSHSYAWRKASGYQSATSEGSGYFGNSGGTISGPGTNPVTIGIKLRFAGGLATTQSLTGAAQSDARVEIIINLGSVVDNTLASIDCTVERVNGTLTQTGCPFTYTPTGDMLFNLQAKVTPNVSTVYFSFTLKTKASAIVTPDDTLSWADADFSHTLGFIPNQPAFDLPAGYTFNVATPNGSIVNNVYYGAPCSYAFNNPGASFPASGGNGAISVNTDASCDWNASTDSSWVNVTSGLGPGPGTASFTLAPNSTMFLRSTNVTIGDASYPITQFGNCTPTVSPASIATAGTAGAVTLNLGNATCGWSATSNASWLTPPASSGTSATLGVSVAANTTGVQRTGTLTISGQTITVTQGANNPLQIPSLVSLSPFQGTGPNAPLTLVYSHPSGYAAIQSAEFIVNPRWEPNARGGACYVKYAPGTGLFTLIGDDGSSVAGTTAPLTGANISNSQCTLNAAASSATGSANTLTLVVSLTFPASFTGQRHIWMQAVDANNLSTNWLVYGVWLPTAATVRTGPWYRIYDPFSKSYLYSFDQNEYNTLGSRGFTPQGISGLVMDSPTTVAGVSNIAWYRVFVNSTNSHLWTSDRNEFLTLINQQQAYVGEGVAAFVMPYIDAQGNVSSQVTNTIPFYRAAYQGANLHFWTADTDEYFGKNGKGLPAGYLGEGVACYIFPASGANLGGAGAQAVPLTERPANDDALAVSDTVAAPGQVISIFGPHSGGRVLVNGVAAEIVPVKESEIQVVLPGGLSVGTEVNLELERGGRRFDPVKLPVVASNPRLFGTNQFGRGIAEAQNADGTTNGAGHAAARGSVVTLYATGFAANVGNELLEVHIGGRPADLLSVGISGTRPGVVEMRVRAPWESEPADFQPVVLHVGNSFSQPGIGLAIR